MHAGIIQQQFTHKAVQRSGVVHELLTEGGGAQSLHTLQADGPQEALLQQGRGQRQGLHAGQGQLHEHQPVHHCWACRDIKYRSTPYCANIHKNKYSIYTYVFLNIIPTHYASLCPCKAPQVVSRCHKKCLKMQLYKIFN